MLTQVDSFRQGVRTLQVDQLPFMALDSDFQVCYGQFKLKTRTVVRGKFEPDSSLQMLSLTGCFEWY